MLHSYSYRNSSAFIGRSFLEKKKNFLLILRIFSRNDFVSERNPIDVETWRFDVSSAGAKFIIFLKGTFAE